MEKATLDKARQVKNEVRDLLKSRPEVVGIGITSDCKDGYAIKVNLSTSFPKDFKLPEDLQGVMILTQVVGKIVFL